jgi:hypothetical protein
MKKFILLMSSLLLLGLFNTVNAQEFIPRTLNFSKKKGCILKTKEGNVVEGTLSGMKFKKGLVEQIKMKDVNGKKLKFKASDVAEFRVPPSSLGKLAALNESTASIKKMTKANFGSIVKKDYVYFEQALLPGKKPRYLLLQLVNPGFDSKIKVYDDPKAKSTGGVAVGGIQATGGELKSYYVVKDDVAQRVKKKDFDEMQSWIFGDCSALNKSFDGELKFKDFAAQVFFYDQECE